MAVPYSQAISQYLGNHTYVKDGGTWRTVEDIQINLVVHGEIRRQYMLKKVVHGEQSMKVISFV